MQTNNSLLRQVDDTGRCIRDAQLARAAIPPLRRLSDLVDLLEEHRQLAVRVLSGDTLAAPRRHAVRESIDSILDRTRPPADGWLQAQAHWRALIGAIERRAIGVLDSEDRHAALIRSYTECLHGMEQLDIRLARRVDDLRRTQGRNLLNFGSSAELICG